MPTFFFYLFAAIVVFAALGVVMARNPLYNVLSLVLVIFGLSSLFVLLEAYFVSVILLLVYAGAVLVFFLFVVMCLNLNAPAFSAIQQSRFRLFGWIATGAFISVCLIAFKSYLTAQALAPSTLRGTIETVGRILFTEYVLPFELTSFLLLIAIFGIVSLAKGAFNTK